jgi:hypothetical protein
MGNAILSLLKKRIIMFITIMNRNLISVSICYSFMPKIKKKANDTVIYLKLMWMSGLVCAYLD